MSHETYETSNCRPLLKLYNLMSNFNRLHSFFSMQSISVPVLTLKIGVEFSLSFEVSSQLRFPWDQNSVNPVRLTAEVNTV